MSRLSHAAIATVAIVAAAAPAASARPALEPPSHPVPSPTPTGVHAAGPGFELGSAAIGAGGATVLLLMTAAGTLTLVRQRGGIRD